MSPADRIGHLAQEVAGDGLVMKAVLIYDVVDDEGERSLNFVVTDKTAKWDLQGMLIGVLDATGNRYRKPT